MIIKVEDSFYHATDQPVMVILTPQDKANIANMPANATKYCAFPDRMSREQIEEWMRDKSAKN
jgi:hypothetical protein